jgi:hypothetical protein
MFLKNPGLPKPLIKRKQKNVVTKTRGPVGHRETDFTAGYQAAHADENYRAKDGQHRKAMKPEAMFFGQHFKY